MVARDDTAACASFSGAEAASDTVVVDDFQTESLQAKATRFRKERQRERTLARRYVRSVSAAGRNVEYLRQRFIDVCKNYVGTPYGRKYHDPGEPEYSAPLFLDCCALVRRAVQDLQDEFGFRIGTWNQAYQFETLPIELSFEELRPGDLVFVEGTYHDGARRPQRHGIVHVEVFLGGETGEATVGSRWGRSDPAEGKVRGVQVHPSYRYVSKKYEIHRYHFRSLETWLQGTCRSLSYPDGRSALAGCGRRSIFEDDEAASGDEEYGSFTPNPYREAPIFYVGEGNNWRVVAAALEGRGWRRLPFDAGFTRCFDLKWVEQRAKIDFKRHMEGQLVNHIPNNDVITSKMRFLDTMRAHEQASGERFMSHPSSYSSERACEKLAALAEAEAAPGATWILKPSRGLGGSGIEVVRGAERLRERLFPPPRDLASDLPRAPPPAEGWVIQRYVEDPLLLRGRKFDVRAYCLVARTTPHLWLFRPGYCKVALELYDAGDLANRHAHLTNACVQKAHPAYRESFRGMHIWSEEEAEAELVASGKWPEGAGRFWPGVHGQMKRALAEVYRASRGALERRAGYFDLLGVDFMLDSNLKLYLLEVNSNPAMFFDDSPVLKDMVPQLIGATLDVVLEAQRPGIDATAAPPYPATFELLVDEATGYLYDET